MNYIIIPILKLISFGKRINRYQAADIIGSFFPEVSDRLKNTLQLKDSLDSNEGNIELLRASVAQRSETLNVVSFSNAVNYQENKKYLKYLLPVFLLFSAVYYFAPNWVLEGTERVVNYTEEYKPKAPFTFHLQNTNLQIEEGQDFKVIIRLKGSEFPEQVYLISESGKFLMEKTAKNEFTGWLKKVKNTTQFHVQGNEFISSKYTLRVIGKAVIGKLQARLIYPKYLGKNPELIQNSGDLTVPEGTSIEWTVQTKNTAFVDFIFNGNSQRNTKNPFTIQKIIKDNSQGKIEFANAVTKKIESTSFLISVIKDASPSIQVDEFTDSIKEGVRYFSGQIADDYGLNSLNFVYTVYSENVKPRSNTLNVKPVNGTQLAFDFAVDFRRENVKLKDRIEYYFIVGDNDGINGSKFTKSQTYIYELPTLEELNDQREIDQAELQKEMNDIINKTQDFQNKVEKLKKEIMNSKSTDWEKLNKVEELKKEQQNLQESLEKIKEEMNQSMEEKNQLSEMDKELVEKQEMIEKLLEEVMDDELKKLLDDLMKLMEENNKQEIKKELDKIDQSAEDMKKQLDRSLEMLKRLQVNEKIDDIEKELNELAKKQEELKKDIQEDKLTEEESVKKQEELNKKFDDLKKELEELKKLNEKLDKPMNLGDTESSEEKISDDMQESKENLQEGKDKKAGEKQKSAADEMKKLAEQLDKQQQEANKQQQEEDIDLLRNILENLIKLSFNQEDVMNKFTKVTDTDPAYKKYGRQQRRIIDDTKIVKDSLLALAKRQPKIATFIDQELNSIEINHDLAIDDIDEHRRRELNKHQQLAMTSYNNLALLLNESLQSMQQQMQSMMEGSGQCNNPGKKGRPKSGQNMSSEDMKQMLKKQLEQMQKGPNKGGKEPGEKEGLEGKPGEKPGQGGMNGMGSKEIAKMAAEQNAIRQRLEQLKKELNKEGKGQGNQLNPLIKELEEQEKQLINKKFNNELLNRQKDIITRLLESEKALMNRGFEDKRESKSGKDKNSGNKINLDEYNKEKLKQVEILRSVDPMYRKYYKDKANQYFNIK
ncbi:MAG: hypothetical protein FJX84_06165 [Bacteroidetes bacterium]|nr:hypothetical protein [Bacteroidota bacterium]